MQELLRKPLDRGVFMNEKIIRNYLGDTLKLNGFRVEQEYNGLKKHPDIEAEFAFYIKNGWVHNGICVSGYTAKLLNEKYPLSPLGAFNYLIYLRENPEEAIANLKKGLPRK